MSWCCARAATAAESAVTTGARADEGHIGCKGRRGSQRVQGQTRVTAGARADEGHIGCNGRREPRGS
eukprot:2714104-Prymnesium_polylepis.2